MREKKLRKIWEKTEGHCHFCGDPVEFENYGRNSETSGGSWEVDHVHQRGKGGKDAVDNYLPACKECNRFRWHRSGEEIRELLLLGLTAHDEVKKGTAIGKSLEELKEKRLRKNEKRRKNQNK